MRLTLAAAAASSVCILAPTAFGIGTTVLAHYEEGGEGVQWGNMLDAPSPNDLAFAQILLHFGIDLVVYLLLGAYLGERRRAWGIETGTRALTRCD